MNQDIKIRFVIPKDVENENECNKNMLNCYKLCTEYRLNIAWIAETDCDSIVCQKTDVFVFQSFEGDVFDTLCKNKCVRILGPQCLHNCLRKGRSIPNILSPIFTNAMVDMIVCCSGLSVQRKTCIKKLVGYMGGLYSPTLTVNTTHLVTNAVNTDKYVKACENKLVIMLETWIDAVWEANLNETVSANSERFNEHRCPPFYKLTITCTGFSLKDRKEISDIVETNGGKYSGKFQSEVTSLLIYNGDTSSQKFLAAKKSSIDCVTTNWLTDSVLAGYALPCDNYKYKVNLSSTLKNTLENTNSLATNFSLMASRIVNDADETVKSVSETFLNFPSISSKGTPTKVLQEDSSLNNIIDSIDLKQVKKSGPFLDGCSVYLTGFTNEQRDKLFKVLNSGGAVRYDDVSERVTHLIVGDPIKNDISLFESRGYHPLYVTVEWLVESIKLKQLSPESDFKVSSNKLEITTPTTLNSPLSKKGVQLLRGETPKSKTIDTDETKMSDNTVEMNIMQQYLTNNEGDTENTLKNFLAGRQHRSQSSTKEMLAIGQNNKSNSKKKDEITVEPDVDENSSDTSTFCENFFEGLTFHLLGWNDELMERVTTIIENCGGKIVSNKTDCNYIIVPHSFPLEDFHDNVLTDIWLDDCITEKAQADIKYYHRPVTISEDVKPLSGLVICVSTYSGFERTYLNWLISHLGAVCQESLARNASTVKNVLASTHLVCPEPTGSKYNAAIKWGLSTVNSSWLIACARERTHVPESDYPVGETSSSVQDVRNTPKNKSTENVTPKVGIKRKTVSKDSIDDCLEQPQSTNVRRSENEEMPPPQSSTKEPEMRDLENANLTEKLQEHISDQSVESDEVFHNENPAENSQNTEMSGIAKFTNYPVMTPVNKLLKRDSMEIQMTPVKKFLEGLGVPKNLPGSPDQPPLPHTPTYVKTPDTPLGRVFGNPDPSPETRKYWARKINNMVPYEYNNPPPKRPRLPSTPISEIKRRYWRKVLPAECFEDENKTNVEKENTNSEQMEKASTSPVVNNQLEELKNMLTRRDSSSSINRRSVLLSDANAHQFQEIPPQDNFIKGSQTDTIGWEEPLEKEALICSSTSTKTYKFMFSQIDLTLRNSYTNSVETLGGTVSDKPNLFDETATHVICNVPSRNEKLLSSIAAGKWILHTSYLDHCASIGKFDNEEMFEFGNPLAKPYIFKLSEGKNAQLIEAIHRWRKQIDKTGKKAYDGMKAIVNVSTNRKDQIVRLIQAGNGIVVDPEPPYKETLGATHCFIEIKKMSELPNCEELAKKGVLCLSHIYLSDYLTSHPPVDPRDFIIESFRKYF